MGGVAHRSEAGVHRVAMGQTNRCHNSVGTFRGIHLGKSVSRLFDATE
jgi:hypothetical protein